MNTSDTYGFVHDDLESACEAIQQALGVQMEAHESSYLGGDYYSGQLPSGAAKLQLRHNVDLLYDERTDPPDERYAEPEFATSPILLYVTGHDSLDVVRTSLERHVAGISFLRRREEKAQPDDEANDRGGRRLS